jgi:phosphotriesterase-related protein
MADIIRTITGDRSPGDFGIMLFHEHIHFSKGFLSKVRGDEPVGGFHLDDIDLVVSEIESAKRAGVTLIVDGGHDDMGRDLGIVRTVSERTGMPIVVGGGYYLQKVYPSRIAESSVESLADEMHAAAQAEDWGILGEIGTSERITPDERKVLQAVARVQRETGLAIITHTEREGLCALEQLSIMEDAGADPARIVIGHLGGMPNTSVHQQILSRGAGVGFDRVSRSENPPGDDLRQARQVADLVGAGWLDHIFVSGDQGSLLDDLIVSGGPGYAKPWTVFGVALTQAGLTYDQIQTIFVDNPRRLLAFTPR